MLDTRSRSEPTGAIRYDLGAIFASLELSQSKWVVTSLLPGDGERMSKHSLPAGSAGALLGHFAKLKDKAFARTGRDYGMVTIQEAGLDGYWLHRVLAGEGVESHVVDPASIMVSRRKRRAKTDRLDGEALLRTLLAYQRGEPRVCSMVRAPSVEQEDARRLIRERKELVAERARLTNGVKGLLFSQGIKGYNPLRRDRWTGLEELTTGDGRHLAKHIEAGLRRMLGRIELLIGQLAAVEAERDAMLEAASAAPGPDPAGMLRGLAGIGPEFAAVLWHEGLFRRFANRRQLAAYAGLAPTPWQSGQVSHELGVSKAGNPRLRTTMIQLAWLWLRHQPDSALSKWFEQRVARNGGRGKKSAIVALARKLLVALWKYVTSGVAIEGAKLKAA